MMFKIIDHVGNETIEEASDEELLASMSAGELAELHRTGAVAVAYCGGIQRFAREDAAR